MNDLASRLRQLLSYCGIIVRPWLCLAVYLWIGEFQASYGTDSEPLLDRLADAAIILWSLVFLTLAFCPLVGLVGLLWGEAMICRANQSLCRICCILVSAIFLARWLDEWVRLQLASPAIHWLVITAVALAYLMVRRQRRMVFAYATFNFPAWQDCFFFGAAPFLLASILVLAIKIATSFDLPKAAAVAQADKFVPNSGVKPPSPNVIVIVSDALRAQSLSLYGNGSASTPALERFARTSSVYLETHANSTSTPSAMTTILTGQHPFKHGRLTREIAPRSDENNLLRILRTRGYHIGAVTSNVEATLSSLALSAELTYPERFAFNFMPVSWLRDFGVYPTRHGGRMYQELSLILPFLGFPGRTSGEGYIENTLNRARDVIIRLEEPFFLVIHIHEPHAYWPTIRRLIKGIGKTIPRFYAYYDRTLQPVVDESRAEYEASVRNVDSELGEFFGFLEQYSWFASSLVIITGDHGESFERGYLGHGEELYENSTWVPLIIRFPEQSAGERTAGLTQSIDIAPTILRALAIPVPDWMEGQTLAKGTLPEDRAVVALNFKHPSENGNYSLPTKLAIWWKRYKMIVDCSRDNTELYDLSTDPDERTNLGNGEFAIVEDLKQRLRLQLAKQPHEPKLACDI